MEIKKGNYVSAVYMGKRYPYSMVLGVDGNNVEIQTTQTTRIVKPTYDKVAYYTNSIYVPKSAIIEVI